MCNPQFLDLNPQPSRYGKRGNSHITGLSVLCSQGKVLEHCGDVAVGREGEKGVLIDPWIEL